MEVLLVSLLILSITYYAVQKERQEHGCTSIGIQKQCDEDQSVYIIGTKPSSADTKAELTQKIESVLSYHEKGAVWRKCWIMSLIFSLVMYLLLRANLNASQRNCVDNTSLFYLILSVQITAFFLTYFYFNYINYHHFRRLKTNGLLILKEVFNRC